MGSKRPKSRREYFGMRSVSFDRRVDDHNNIHPESAVSQPLRSGGVLADFAGGKNKPVRMEPLRGFIEFLQGLTHNGP
jgi:hypothetical protein